MNSRKLAVAILVIALGLISFWGWHSRRDQPQLREASSDPKKSDSAQVTSLRPPGLPPASMPFANVPAATPPGSVPAIASTLPLSPEQVAAIDLEKARRIIADYHNLMGENPVGTNAEIMTELMGKNPRQATLGPAEGQALNSQGELVDTWGTPYFFHQLSKDEMEVHSAGADKIMGTPDDEVAR